MRIATFCICCLLALPAGCKRGNPTIDSATSPKTEVRSSPRSVAADHNYETGPAPFDVCALLQREEIQAITGSAIEQSKSSGRSDGNFRISQCIYVARHADQSISLVATHTDPTAKQKRSPKEFWRERFGRYREQGKEKDEEETKISGESEVEERESEEGRPPRKIEGLAEEAFWTAGSLYVLQRDAFLRLSIGGSDSEETKLEHAKALAAIALKRL